MQCSSQEKFVIVGANSLSDLVKVGADREPPRAILVNDLIDSRFYSTWASTVFHTASLSPLQGVGTRPWLCLDFLCLL